MLEPQHQVRFTEYCKVSMLSMQLQLHLVGYKVSWKQSDSRSVGGKHTRSMAWPTV